VNAVSQTSEKEREREQAISHWPCDAEASALHRSTILSQELLHNLVKTLVLVTGKGLAHDDSRPLAFHF